MRVSQNVMEAMEERLEKCLSILYYKECLAVAC